MDDSQFREFSGNVIRDWNAINGTENNVPSWFKSDITLSYINKLLMQEESNDKVTLDHGESALKAMEEPFCRLLGQNDYLNNLDVTADNSVVIDSSNTNSSDILQVPEAPWTLSAIVGERKMITQSTHRTEFPLNVNDLSIVENHSKGDPSFQVNNRGTRKHASLEFECQGSYPCTEDFSLLDGRSHKQFAICSDELIRDETFDKVLLFSRHKNVDEAIVLQETTTTKSAENSQNNQGKTSARRKKKGKKQLKKEVVDLRTLLMQCAQAVSANNRTLACDILNTIRQHSSASGDDSQRLAFCLADCLEVRLAGSGSRIYKELTSKAFNARDMLKLFHLCLTVTPFLRAPYYLSNKTIIDISMGKHRIHIIDFGILFGFQWPSLFEELAKGECRPHMVRITGIDLPERGFRPNRVNRNTGELLARYAKMFNIPFEYQGISANWETICVEDFNIQKDDVLIVNCTYRMNNLGDETISISSARNRVLNMIRMMKPKVFVLGIVNGSYSTPFFLTRFKEVMYHYAAIFDLLDKTVPLAHNEARMMLEREIYRGILTNVIACEGSERIERPEGYKKWKARNLNAGLEQLPLNPEIVKGTKDMVKMLYHKDYVVNEDDQWLLLGWKGKIIYAISTWKSNESSGSH